MLVAAGGGGAGGTPWGMMTMQQMQANIQNPDTDKHYELLTGWKRSADLINEHRWQVQNYRDNLAAAWPPATNKASEAYISRLNELIANLEETYEAAIANHDAFASATLSISLAQKKMDEIAREYLGNEQALADFNAKKANTSGQPQPSPSPSGEQPPFAPGRQEELHQQAVVLLSGVSGDLAQAQVSIRTPTPYRQILTDDTKHINEGQPYTAPPIPPITPVYPGGSASAPSTQRPSTTFPTNTLPPAATAPPVTSGAQPGLVLGGANQVPLAPSLTPPGINGVPSPSPSGGAPGLIGNTGMLPPGNGYLPPANPSAVPPVSNLGRSVNGPREGFIRPGNAISGGGLHAMPPGGLIGTVPGGGIAQPGSTRSAINRVNPVGGMIGGSEPQTRSSTHSNALSGHLSGTTPLGHVGGRRGSNGSESESTNWDPDNPWETAEGVAPVVLPPREKRIDPGPAIGL
ncbi:hypothetical protein KOI35_05220 [Actinoplanes bogorensis]|uniref:PPE family domain-containing protein n=1 Tax=Paractinoplanes bogorensis TaxID=1610840 RepID=A0ABS5YHN9_9ACTN|nr:hypothetical protein [Actinoplanes bogorensis]MBU2662903.1 hypothetical protein [Actinoplanes bogorensis]